MSEPPKPSPQAVTLINPDGKIVTVPGSQLGAALEQGYMPPSAGQQTEAAQRQEYGQGLGTELRAGAEGAARGLTFGLSDLAMAKSGLVDRTGLEERKARNPYAAGIGEAAGVVGGMFVPVVKGASLLGEAASGLAGRGLAKAGIGAADTLAQRALAKGVTAGAGSAVEGALYGGGQGISEVALGDPEDAAQKILAHATMGALLGGGIGGAAGALGAVGSKALARIKPGTTAALDVAEGAPQAPSRLHDYFKDLAGEQALDAAGLMTRDYTNLSRLAKPLDAGSTLEQQAASGEAREALTLRDEAKRMMLKHDIVGAGSTVTSINRKVSQVISEAQQKAARFIANLDARAEAHSFDVAAYAQDLKKVAKQFERSPEHLSDYNELLKRADAYAKLGEGTGGKISLAEAEGLKRGFDNAFATSSVSKQITRESRGLLNERIENTAKELTSPEAYNAWRQDKRTMEALIPVARAGEKKLEKMQGNRKVSLTSYLTGLAGMGAIGVNPAGVASGLAMSLAHKVVLERGNAFVSAMARRAADVLDPAAARAMQLAHMEKAANAVTTQVRTAMDGLVSQLGQVPKSSSALAVTGMHDIAFAPRERDERNEQADHYDKRMTEISNLVGNPQLLQQRLQSTVGDLQQFAPRVSFELQSQVTTALHYLAGKAPKNPYPNAPQDIREAWRPSTGDLVSFERTLQAAHDPLSVVKAFEHGHVSSEAVDVLRTIYPSIYNQVVAHVVPHVPKQAHIPLQRRLELSKLLGTTLDDLSSPEFAKSLQAIYAKPSPQPAPPRPGVNKNYRANQSQTPLQRALGG